MTTPAPSPGPVKRSRRMLGFYVGAGVVLALFLLAVCAWAPLRVWYWEREVRRSRTLGHPGSRIEAAETLASMGPVAGAAFERLMRDHDLDVCRDAGQALGDPRNTWALPMLVRCSAQLEAEYQYLAVHAAEKISGQTFFVPSDDGLDADVRRSYHQLVAWWEREGRAKCGRPE